MYRKQEHSCWDKKVNVRACICFWHLVGISLLAVETPWGPEIKTQIQVSCWFVVIHWKLAWVMPSSTPSWAFTNEKELHEWLWIFVSHAVPNLNRLLNYKDFFPLYANNWNIFANPWCLMCSPGSSQKLSLLLTFFSACNFPSANTIWFLQVYT